MAAGALAIAALIEQLLPIAVSTYKEIAAAHSEAALPPVETILAKADANWDLVNTTAQAQLNLTPVGTPVLPPVQPSK